MSDHDQISLFEQGAVADAPAQTWPDASRFPLNLVGEGTVAGVVEKDLAGCADALVVAGYAGLGRLVSFLGKQSLSADQPFRLLLGAEPYPTARSDFSMRGRDLPDEVRAFWLSRGVSLRLSGMLLQVIEDLRRGAIRARYMPRHRGILHAKIYCADDIATLGSSNFSDAGLTRNLEANARFGPRDGKRAGELRRMAENYWVMGEDFNEELVALLEQLLQFVSWQEALARACAELLEGDWAEEYLKHFGLADDTPLWPSQVRGIAQALMLLRQVGSVLVADATGSGKTRMGVHLIRGLLHQIWSSNRRRKGEPVMVCPPLVRVGWEGESAKIGLPLATTSHGMLSHRGGENAEIMLQRLTRAQVLAIDEAHNFLNLGSQRTQAILRNMADHTLLFTATPINRSSTDLLRIADLIGADNLAPETVRMFEKLLGRRRLNRSLSEGEHEALKREIGRFVVRRTKTQLNHMIDEEPEAYRDGAGALCRYPRHQAHTYELDEPKVDRDAAARITELADRLQGVNYLVGEIALPPALRREGWSEEKYLASRLKGARKLAAYMIRARLRSSRVALIEYLTGTRRALELFNLRENFSKGSSGDVINRLGKLKGYPPRNRLDLALPEWLTDKDSHRAACEAEGRIYEEIFAIAWKELSDAREQRKAGLIRELLDQHELVLAFDSCPITLAMIRRELNAMDAGITACIATGDPASERREIATAFSPGSGRRRVVGLCSDSLAEGVNLQQASAVVHLDMPSVVRIAEQRVGRVDRMDSPHEQVDLYWPRDAAEFALTTDERFVERFETVENLLGANMALPEHLVGSRRSKPVDTERLVEEFEQAMAVEEWDGLEDAFSPVRSLVDGPHALVPRQTYRDYRHETARVLARVSVAPARRPWAFFCLRGDRHRPPAWVLLPSVEARPVTELAEICAGLRERLADDPQSPAMSERHLRWLQRFLRRLGRAERDRLPRKKRRALDEMGKVLAVYRQEAANDRRQADLQTCDRLIQWLNTTDPERMPDWEAMAERWLDLIRPVWYQALQERRRRRPLRLADLRPHLLGEHKLSIEDLRATFETVPRLPPVEERIAACVLGIPGGP